MPVESSSPRSPWGSSLADQALANLVNQFARPLDFLRELAQNAIDAGSPRIDVSVAYTEPVGADAEGVLRISVDDYGEGMDEDTIDNQLTRLFSSTKEHDLTKIGKFGIGFTSIFAIRPEAVLLRTGRQGEYWELLFHPDRSFDKVRITEPVKGTKISLFKRIPPAEVERYVQEIRFVLGYWCEHSETPITFVDHTHAAPPEVDADPDPFAAFAAPAEAPIASHAPGQPDHTAPASRGADRIDRDLALDVPIEVRHLEAGLEVVIGFADPPRFGFYNGGLTLLNTQTPAALGVYARRLGHCTFKVKYDRLEHTLTRDNVLVDENFVAAMEGVVRAHAALRKRLLDEIRAAAASGSPLDGLQRHLADDCAAATEPNPRDLRDLPAFRDVYGRAITLGAVRAQEAKLGCVLVGGGPSPLCEALGELGFVVLVDTPEARQLLQATEEPVLFDFFRRKTSIRRAEELFVAPALVGIEALDPTELRLMRRTEEWLGKAVGLQMRVPGTQRVIRWAPAPDGWLNRLTVRIGDFGGTDLARAEVLALNGPPDGRVFLRPERNQFELPAFLHWRCLLVNRHHPLFRAQLLASAEDLDLASFGLASALLHVEGVEGEAAHARMVGAMFAALDAALEPAASPTLTHPTTTQPETSQASRASAPTAPQTVSQSTGSRRDP